MSLSIIAAMDLNQLIGQGTKIPWNIPEDLKYFKETTMGSPVIMGRKTHESIGSALPGRRNIILTRNKDYYSRNCEVTNYYKKVLREFETSKEEAFIIGGAEIYNLFLPFSRKLYLTVVRDEFINSYDDAYFPNIRWTNWTRISKKQGPMNMENPYSYTFNVYNRRKNKIGENFNESIS